MKITIVGMVGMIAATALGGCATHRDDIVLIEPSYSFVNDAEVRADRIARGRDSSLTIAADLSAPAQDTRP